MEKVFEQIMEESEDDLRSNQFFVSMPFASKYDEVFKAFEFAVSTVYSEKGGK